MKQQNWFNLLAGCFCTAAGIICVTGGNTVGAVIDLILGIVNIAIFAVTVALNLHRNRRNRK